MLYTDSGSLRLTRVSPLGVVKDPNGIVIAEPGALGVLACGSDNCLVAWGAAVGGVLVTRLAADGSKLDSPPIQIVDKVGPTMLAARGSGYVLQYDNGTEGGGTVFLDATGHKSGPLKPRKAQREYPCGSNFLVFKQPPVTPGSPGSFVVSLVDVAGSVLVDNVNVGWRMSSEYGVASRATGCAVAALKQTDDSNDIYANFIQNDGSVGLPQAIPIATDAFNEVSPALAFDGDRLLVAYSHLIPTAPYGNFRIAARLVSQGEINPGTGGAAGGLAGTGGGVGTGGSGVGTGGSGVGTGGSGVGTGGSGVGTGGSGVGTGGSGVGTGGSGVGTGGSGVGTGGSGVGTGGSGVGTGGSGVGTGGSGVGTGGSGVGTGGSGVGTGGSGVGTGGSGVGTGGSGVGTGGSGDAAGSGDLAAGVAGISTSDGGAAGDAEEVGVGGIINTGGGGRSAIGGSAVGAPPATRAENEAAVAR